MARIRVDTEELKRSAREIGSVAENVGKAGDEILAVAMALPSYEGQLSGPARKAGYEIQTQTRDLKAALAGDADSILKSAQAFEEVDSQTVERLNQNLDDILAGGISDGGFNPDRSHGNSYLGYNEDPLNPGVIILCMYGECRKVIVTDENKAAIEDFKQQVDGGDGYTQARKRMEDANLAMARDAILIVGSVLVGGGLAEITVGGSAVGAVIAVAFLYDDLAKQSKIVAEEAQKMVAATNNAAADWNSIFIGANKTGDPYQIPGHPGQGSDKPVYDPPETPISSETPEPN